MNTVLITGANRGIGLAFARAFAARGDTVVGTAREPATADDLRASGAEVEELDVTDDASVSALAERLSGRRVDLLINNAGILRRDRLDTADAQSLLRQFDVNALGPLRVTKAMVSNLRLSSHPRVVNLTSRMGSIGDNSSGGFYGYRASKAALNAITRSLAIDLAPVPVICVHPGYVRSRMTGNQGDLTPEEAVERMLPLLDRLDRTQSGKFFHRDGHELPW